MSTPGTRAPRLAPAQRRAQIAAAARALAVDEGLAAVTLRAVAARAGVTPALVAHYVPSMDALVAETFRVIVGTELDELIAIASGDDGAHARLGRLLRAVLDGTRDDVTLVWVEAYALGRGSEALAGAVRTQMDRWQAVLHDLVADGAREGAFVVDRPVDAAWQLLGMLDGLNAQALVRWGARRDEPTDRVALTLRAVEGMLGLAPGALDPETPDAPEEGTP